MEITPSNKLPAFPGVIHALGGGFNTVANHIWLIAWPVVFDLFLWLGPRLGLGPILEPLFAEWVAAQSQVTAAQVQQMEVMVKGFNGFSLAGTFPVGVFSLMSANFVGESPLGARPEWLLSGPAGFAGWLVFLTIAGWLAGCLYFYQVARVVYSDASGPSLVRAVGNGLALSVFLVLLAFFASLPVFFMLGVLLLINPAIASFASALLLFVMIWLAVVAFFSAHGVFSVGLNFFQSIIKAAWLARYAMPMLGWFALLAVGLNQGLSLLWRVAPPTSWMALVGILGHAFISTSLLAASFIYYRELTQWVEQALAILKSQTISSAQA